MMSNKLRDEKPTPPTFTFCCGHMKDIRECGCKKPTPCSHEWQIQHDEVKSYWQCVHCLLRKTSVKLTPEEKCEHKRITTFVHCADCNHYVDPSVVEEHPKPSPSPEARVDWEKEANKMIDDELYHVTIDGSKRRLHLTERIAKALSAAFEKGREAR